MGVFPHQEFKYYGFGLRVGLTNLFSNGLRLGLKKTVGKIAQPINAPSRFPEYHGFDLAIRDYLSAIPAAHKPRVLDVGSPKLLGLYLGHSVGAHVTLTDISELNVDEYRVMWRGLQSTARGTVEFSLQDARSLQFPASQFDVVYSMSVIEHIDGEAGDAKAVQEFLRVLKPGGLLVLSVPFGGTYMEQQRIGFAGAARRTGDQSAYFFQRIYDQPSFEQRILAHTGGLEHVTFTTVERRNEWLTRGFGRLGENVRGALGFLNPILSASINSTREGIGSLRSTYGPMYTASDVYGDLILIGRKSTDHVQRA